MIWNKWGAIRDQKNELQHYILSITFLDKSCQVELKYNFSLFFFSFELSPLTLRTQDICPHMTLGPETFSRKFPTKF